MLRLMGAVQAISFSAQSNKALQLTARQHVSQVILFFAAWMLIARRSSRPALCGYRKFQR
jgi:hypothetical protein